MNIHKNKNNKCLRIGKCSLYYIYILIIVLLFIIKSSLLSLHDLEIRKDYNIIGIETILYKHGLIKIIIEKLGCIFYGCIFMLIFKNNKKKKELDINNELKIDESQNKSSNITLLYNGDNVFKKCSINLLIACVVYATQLTIKNSLTIMKLGMFEFWIFNIIFIIIFLKTILKYKIYKLQNYIFIFNIVTNFILFLAASFILNTNGKNDYINVKEAFGNHGYNVLFYIVFLSFSCMLCFSQVWQKKVMDYEYISPSKVVFTSGIISTIFLLIALVITTFVNCNEVLTKKKLCPISKPEHQFAYLDNFFVFFDSLGSKYRENKKDFFLEILLIYPLYSFVGFMKYFCETMIIYHLNPYYVQISNNIFYSITIIIRLVYYPTSIRIYLRLLAEFIASIANLFFLEILEFNCCGLNFDTRRNIEKRSQNESIKDILKYDDNNSNNSDNQTDIDIKSINPDGLLKDDDVYTIYT